MYTTRTDTAVVVLSYNGRNYHEAFFPLLIAESKGRYDVVLIDNASTDDTRSFVQQQFPEVHVIHLPQNKGFTGGYAAGIEQIRSKYLVLLSADFEVSPGWFDPLHSFMEQRPDVAVVQPKILYQREKHMFEYAGAAGGFMDGLGYPFCRGRIFFTLEEDKQQYQQPIECFWASGGCFFIRAELFREFNGLEPDFFAHMEEIDLCWRLKNAGHKVYCIPQSQVYHVGGSVISYGSPQKVYLNFRNGLFMLIKNYGTGELLWKLPVRLLLDVVAAWKGLLSGNTGEFMAIARAHLHFIKGLPLFLKKRRSAKAQRSTPNRTGIYKRSIVWDYFIRRRRTFDQLDTTRFR